MPDNQGQRFAKQHQVWIFVLIVNELPSAIWNPPSNIQNYQLTKINSPSVQQPASIHYWLFQSNPAVFRLREALRAEALESFAVRAHKDKIKPGDRVILWQAGDAAGCYALATVLSPPDMRPIAEVERPFFRQAPEPDLRVALRIDYNLWYRPITWDMLPPTTAFQEVNAGLPGTTFRATAEQYRQLVTLIEQQDLLREPEIAYGAPEPPVHPLNLILYGPPGTGKTYLTVNHALAIIEHRTLEELALENRAELRRRFALYQAAGRIVVVTFHPSFSYEDFVEGLKPEMTEGGVNYRVEAGIFTVLCREARRARREALAEQRPAGPAWSEEEEVDSSDSLPAVGQRPVGRRFVLVIDEVNRGNLAAIFGELITLLDPDKREGQTEATRVVLPYSKRSLAVPPNLFLIGTMNSTDRSAEPMDTALRRRFAFRELRSDPALIPRMARQPVTAGVDLERLLRAINERIARLLHPDFCIGHGYFLDVASLDDLRQLFDQRIIPLLREYFFNDLGKIGLVLGPAFVRPNPEEDLAHLFADFDFPLPPDLSDSRPYSLSPPEQWDERAFISVYERGE